MSSAGSTEFRPWHYFVLAGLIAATAAVWLARPAEPATLILLSLAVGAAALAGLGAYRMLWPLVAREFTDGIPMVGPRTRAALERDKTLVLRAIKELEFDRAMGKVSEADFQDMVTRLRARALTLIRQLDRAGSPYRDLIEQELRLRLAAYAATEAAGHSAPVESAPGAAGRAGSPGGTTRAASANTGKVPAAGETASAWGRLCGACATRNDPDARFCKQCGAKLPDNADP